jgi:3-deoxy-manno-octulosonate cytidylyltransferase (CMP-KDO synthetase)
MRAAIVIPARYASTRLPGKPLLARTGKPLIQHVYERAKQVKSAPLVIVATDDKRIFECVKKFGGEVVMTRSDHESGSGRVAEASQDLEADIIVNLQGDEPEVDPVHIDRLIALQKSSGALASTLACPFLADANSGSGSPEDPAAVKAILGAKICDDARWARYFTRRLGIWPRNEDGSISSPADYFLHVGVYAFSKSSLAKFAAASAGALEQIERLEQLRILELGERIAVGIVPHAAPGIDTLEDYEAFVRRALKGAA